MFFLSKTDHKRAAEIDAETARLELIHEVLKRLAEKHQAGEDTAPLLAVLEILNAKEI